VAGAPLGSGRLMQSRAVARVGCDSSTPHLIIATYSLRLTITGWLKQPIKYQTSGPRGLIRACDWSMLFAFAFARNTLTHFAGLCIPITQSHEGLHKAFGGPETGVHKPNTYVTPIVSNYL